jgi:hypothetical protein
MSINYIGPFNSTRDWAKVECLMSNLIAEESATMVYSQMLSKLRCEVDSEIQKTGRAARGSTAWMAGITSHPRVPTPPVPAPAPESTRAQAESIAGRLRRGLLAQREFMRKIWARPLDDDKRTYSYRAGDFTTLNVPQWAKPGGHEMEYQQVAMERVMLSWEMIKAFITPYFAIAPFLDGLEKLHNLFKGNTWAKDGKVFWKPPETAPTHEDVICILKGMLDGMTEENDPYPDATQITDGRMRYEKFLEGGRFPQFAMPSMAAGNQATASDTTTGSTVTHPSIGSKKRGWNSAPQR